MENERDQIKKRLELGDEERQQIREIFQEEVVPKLNRLHARVGTISCAFAGKKYEDWCVRFESVGSGFQIIEFEHDEDASDMDFDL